MIGEGTHSTNQRSHTYLRDHVEVGFFTDPTVCIGCKACEVAWRPNDVQFVADIPPSRGPLSGIAASLVKIHTSHLLALAIDMPFMTENYLHSICDAIEPGRGIIAKIDNRAEPLAAAYPREAEIDFRTALAGTDLSLQNVVRRLVVSGKLLEISATEHERGLFRNVNNVSDADAAIASG